VISYSLRLVAVADVYADTPQDRLHLLGDDRPLLGDDRPAVLGFLLGRADRVIEQRGHVIEQRGHVIEQRGHVMALVDVVAHAPMYRSRAREDQVE